MSTLTSVSVSIHVLRMLNVQREGKRQEGRENEKLKKGLIAIENMLQGMVRLVKDLTSSQSRVVLLRQEVVLFGLLVLLHLAVLPDLILLKILMMLMCLTLCMVAWTLLRVWERTGLLMQFKDI